MIIDPENQNNQNDGVGPEPDEFVDSSFMVSFKNNGDSSVSDAIRESENTSGTDPIDEFDEFENFNYDSSKSAFKPLDKPVEVAPEPPKASEKSDFEQVASAGDPAFTDPAFTDGNIDFKEFTGIDNNVNPADNKLFEAGQDLDFASSSSSNSTFAGMPDDEFDLDEEALSINPFKPKNADRIPPAPSKPETEPAKTEPAKAEPKPEVKDNEAANIKTYGKVSSGVDAFKKPAAAPAPKAPEKKADVPGSVNANALRQDHVPSIMKSSDSKRSPFVVDKSVAEDNVKEEDSKKSPFVVETTTEPKAAPAPAPVKAPVRPQPTSNAAKVMKNDSKPEAPKAAPAPKAASESNASENPFVSPAKNAPKSNVRPAASTSIPNEKGAASRPGTSHHTAPSKPEHTAKTEHSSKIDPVTQVSKTKHKSKSEKKVKEPGKGGIIALIGVLAAIFVVLWVMDNYQQWFGKTDNNTTRATQVTAVTTVNEETEATVSEETAAAVATEATTETAPVETTEATETVETTSAETSEETTEATTEETTESTTATTTEEETTASTTRSSSNTPVSCSYDIANPRVTSDGFVFDFAITNNGDNLNVSRLNEITISFNTSSTITSLTSDYFTFTSDGNNSFTGTPRSGSLPAGETTNITITGTTENHVQHFYINTYHFDWN